jgi:DNA-binding transcriptional LysR family regulator
MQSGDGDLAMGSLLGLAAGFYEQTLFEQDWICLANGRHPRIGKQFTMKQYLAENHIGILTSTGTKIVDPELKKQRIERNILLQIPGFLGLAAILSTSDMVATLPRGIGESLAKSAGLKVLPCPVKLPLLTVKQHWHARYHYDAGNRWLRGIIAELFLQSKPRARPR